MDRFTKGFILILAGMIILEIFERFLVKAYEADQAERDKAKNG